VNVVVLLGAPGAGKGTQAPLLATRLGIPVVATGDLFRAAVRDGTALGVQARRYMDAGQLVPDDITVRLLRERLARDDAQAGVILDGFPRTAGQAEALDVALAEQEDRIARAILIDVPVEALVERMSGRLICRARGHVYHRAASPPRVEGVCDLDGSELYQRTDDRPETIRVRLNAQLGALDEVVDHYRRKGVLAEIPGLRDVDDVADDVLGAVTSAGVEVTSERRGSA
jgi:adenylate kinase